MTCADGLRVFATKVSWASWATTMMPSGGSLRTFSFSRHAVSAWGAS